MQDRLAQGFDRLLQFPDALLIALGAHQEHVQVEYLQFIPQRKVLPCGLALLLQRLDALLQLGQDVLHAVQVVRGVVHAALGVLLARLELHDSGGLLKDLAAILRLDGEDLVDAALADHRIAVLADAGVAEEIHDVAQAAGRAVDLVLALTAAVHAPGDAHLGEVDGQGVILVVEDQRHLAEGQALALLGSVEDHVLHLGAAQRLGALLTQHPLHRVGNVALAAAVGADHAGNSILKYDLHAVRKGLEPVDDQLFQSQCRPTLPFS